MKKKTTKKKTKQAKEDKRRLDAKERIKITEDHIKNHGGEYVAEVFLEKAESPTHPAHEWFDWEEGVAAHKWRLQQARMFPKVTVLVETTKVFDLTDGTISIAPLLVSPIETRHVGHGGRYILADSIEGKCRTACRVADDAQGMDKAIPLCDPRVSIKDS